MPIQLEIFHPDRIVVCIARGEIGVEEYGKMIADLMAAGVMHYRKIIDVAGAASATIGENELMSVDKRLREFVNLRQRGPLAIVMGERMTELARIFKEQTEDGRPVELFRSIHDARKWLASYPWSG